tara:strand:+ start:3348 stop:4367 length:1020 start_codon:yes stop_codon:yes gene_type:complete
MNICIENPNKRKKKLTRIITDNEFKIPNYSEYEIFYSCSYSIIFLKEICKNYKLKISGNKNELKERIYYYLFKSYFCIKIQKNIRRFLINKYLNLIGPGLNYKLCKNDTDFFTLENLNDIQIYHFFSYRGNDNSLWGFNIISIYNLFLKSSNNDNGDVLNPYTREKIEPRSQIFNNIKTMIRMSKIYTDGINLKINNQEVNNSKKIIEIKSLELFQIMDSHGNYTDINWFRSLNKNLLIKFLTELLDIWQYRAELSNNIRKDICHPYGNPFRFITISNINNLNFFSLQKNTLFVIEQFITKGINRDMCSLGINYVLCAFTLVNQNAANALPWLYESVAV